MRRGRCPIWTHPPEPAAGLGLDIRADGLAACVVRTAPGLGWRDVDAGALLRGFTRQLKLPVTADNEANLAALGTAGTALGVALSDMVNILDIDTVLLGGSFSLLSSWLAANARTEIDQRVLTAAWAPVTVRPALLGPDAAVIGAALTSIDQIRQHPIAWLAQQPPGPARTTPPKTFTCTAMTGGYSGPGIRDAASPLPGSIRKPERPIEPLRVQGSIQPWP